MVISAILFLELSVGIWESNLGSTGRFLEASWFDKLYNRMSFCAETLNLGCMNLSLPLKTFIWKLFIPCTHCQPHIHSIKYSAYKSKTLSYFLITYSPKNHHSKHCFKQGLYARPVIVDSFWDSPLPQLPSCILSLSL